MAFPEPGEKRLQYINSSVLSQLDRDAEILDREAEINSVSDFLFDRVSKSGIRFATPLSDDLRSGLDLLAYGKDHIMDFVSKDKYLPRVLGFSANEIDERLGDCKTVGELRSKIAEAK